MLAIGHEEILKYPFLTDAGNYLKDKGFTLEQFGTDPDLKIILEEAYERILIATEGKIYKPDYVEGGNVSDSYLPREVFSFLLAIVLLKLTGVNTLIKRFSLAEARRAEKYLERDLGNSTSSDSIDLAKRILNELFSISVEKEGDYFVIPVSEYLRHSVHFHEKEWKLVNRRVDRGIVFLTAHETVRLVRKELGNYINSKINSMKMPETPPGFEDTVAKLRKLGQKFATYSLEDPSDINYPPCIKHAISVLEKGENLPHSGRFLLATYMLSKGKTVEQVAPLFKNAPDYNEKITMYQLNHLAGTSGSGTKYSCPSCEKLKTQNLCYEIPACDGIINPLQFGRKKTR